MRPAIAVAATGSVGETIAPRTKAAGHDMSSITAWATSATASAVASTSPIASMLIWRTFSRSSRRPVKKLAL